MSTPVAFVARSQRRCRRVASIGLTLFVGIAGAVSLAFIAGARRSASVVDRMFAATPRYDTTVYGATLERSAVQSLPGVQRADPSGYIATNVVSPTGEVVGGVDGFTMDFASPVDAPLHVLKGRVPNGGNELETVINETFARSYHVTAGDTVTVRMYSNDQSDSVAQGSYDPTGPTYVVTVGAIIRPPSEVAVDEPRTAVAHLGGGEMWFSDDFWEHHHNEFLSYGQQYYLSLADGQNGIPALTAALPSLANSNGEAPFLLPDERFSRRASYATPVGLETTALLALGVGVAIAAAVTLVLLLRTEQRFHDRDVLGLRTLGFSSPQLAMVAALRTLPVALGGNALAMAGAIALSGRFPIGIGRELELHTGLQVNAAVVLLGTASIVVLVTGGSMLVSRSWLRNRSVIPSRFTLPRWLRRVGAPTDVTLGAHLAFEGAHGRRSITTAQGVAGCAAALVVVGAVGMWVAGVDRLYEVPASHGWPWDAAIGNSNFAMRPETTERLVADPLIAAQTRASFGQAMLDGVSSELFAIDASGSAPPVIVDGRLPTGSNEVAIGTRMLRRLGVDLGGTVTMSLADGEFDPGTRTATGTPLPEVKMTVVGTALAPMFGESDVGDVSVVTFDAIRAGGGDTSPRFVMARFAGADPAATSAAIDREFTEDQLLDIIPARVVNMHRVRSVPLLGIALAGVLGAITLAYVIVAGARTHRRDVAVLRSIGLEPRRVRRVLMWQGTLTAVAAATVGLPVSLLAGAALWRRVAADTGVQPGSVVPSAIVVVVPASLAVALGASLFIGVRLRRSPIAEQLHEE